MARQDEFSAIASEVSGRYTHYLEQLQNSYNRTILSQNLNSKSVASFRKEVDNLNKQFLEREIEQLTTVYEKLDTMISEDTKEQPVRVTEDEEWEIYLSENTNFLFEAIKLQAIKDALYISNFLRSKVLEVMSMNGHEIAYNLVYGAKDIAYNLVYGAKDLAFFYTDKIGRKINSVKYIRTITRDYLVKNYNDMIAGAAILNGITTLTLINTDSTHKDHEKTISVNEEGTINYFMIRTDTFHPNTNTIIRL